MKRLLLSLLTLLLVIIPPLGAQEITKENPAGVSVWPELWQFKADVAKGRPDGGMAVRYILNKSNYNIELRKYSFVVSIWREKDPLHPGVLDGRITDWSRMERLPFAISPRDRNDFYHITSPQNAPEGYEVVTEARREATWTSAFTYYIQKNFFNYCIAQLSPSARKLQVRFYVRYDMVYDGDQWESGQKHPIQGRVSNANTKVSNFATEGVSVTQTASPLRVKTKLTKVKGKEEMDSGATEDSYFLSFEFPMHPANCPYEVSICFWREKDPANPLYNDGVIGDFKMMDLMQFTQSVQYPSIIGATWFNESDYHIVSEYVEKKKSWDSFSIEIPEALFWNFCRPEIPEGKNQLSVRTYITYCITYSGGMVSNEQEVLPWVEQIYYRPYNPKIEDLGTDDISDLFDDDPTPKKPSTPQDCKHVFQLRHYRCMYPYAIPDPPEPKDGDGKTLTTYHAHYDYLMYYPTCIITPQKQCVERSALPNEFTFEAAQHRSVFVRNIDDCHICKSVAVEGLWAAMFPEPEVSRGHTTDDNTPLRHLGPEQAAQLVNRMNDYAKEKNLSWVFTVATVHEAKHAGLDFVESDNEDAEAYTADGCFYITAQSTLRATVKRINTIYAIVKAHTAECVYPGCDYAIPERRHYAHSHSERVANRSCEWHERWYAQRNKETEANMSKLMAGILKDNEDDTPKTQPRFIWYVEDTPYRECTICHVSQSLTEESTIRRFTSKIEAQQYFYSLK